MKITKTEIEGVVIIEPSVFTDSRGYFFESFSYKDFSQKVVDTIFVQDNESYSVYGVLRGLHSQRPTCAQAQQVHVVKGLILDIAVDIRKESATFGNYIAIELSDINKRQLSIPHGFAHGFVVLSDDAIVNYKSDNYYSPESEGSILWNDSQLNIDWILPIDEIVLSDKDKMSPMFKDIVPF